MSAQKDQHTALELKNKACLSKYSGEDTVLAKRALHDLLLEAAGAPSQ